MYDYFDFQDTGFAYVHTPILTSSDCEGGSNSFQVQNDFFASSTFLSVSGQLHLESVAQNGFTFGPVFRAEKHHTPRHLAEFWMLEAELMFVDDINTLMDHVEAALRFPCSRWKCIEEIKYLNDKSGTNVEAGFLEKPIRRITYDEAIFELRQSTENFKYPCSEEMVLHTEHEKYLSRNSPVFITNYPISQKPFYMKEKHGRAENFDLIFPRVGEIAGGSLREDNFEILLKQISDRGLDSSKYDWYLDLRRYGSAPHGGFGIGFDRMIQFWSGAENIRDVTLFPRTEGKIFA